MKNFIKYLSIPFLAMILYVAFLATMVNAENDRVIQAQIANGAISNYVSK